MAPPAGKWITEREAIEKFDIRNRAPISNFGYLGVLLHEGDLDLGAMPMDTWLFDAPHERNPRRVPPCLVIVDGSLRSSQGLTLPDDPCACLLVCGDLFVPWLTLGYRQAILVCGDATIGAAVVAMCTSGEFRIGGEARVPYVFNNSDNLISARGENWRSVLYRQPGDLQPLCRELELEGIDFDDPDSEPHFRVIEALLGNLD